jgi:hypothetical protein
MNIYHKRLSLPFEFNPKFPEFPENWNWGGSTLIPYKPRPADLKNWLTSLGYKIELFDTFIIKPFSRLGVHLDGNIFDNKAKLNFVYGDGKMCWYKLREGKTHRVSYTKEGTEYFEPYNLEDLEEVYRASIGQPSLINAGQFHSVENDSAQHRYCFTVWLKHIENNSWVTWNDAFEKFKPYFVDDSEEVSTI